jgi:hypothetical protein
VQFVEKAFRDRGMRSAYVKVPLHATLAAVVKRQILEGVLAVVKLQRFNQVSGKLHLQVFDRSGGVDNVRFEGKSKSCKPRPVLILLRIRRSRGTYRRRDCDSS